LECNTPTTQLFTVTKCVCIIDSKEPTNIAAGQSVRIDEAMLYATYTPPLPDTPKVVPFAHICFSPKYVEKETVFAIEWYIIC
jgi:hypothetical protein